MPCKHLIGLYGALGSRQAGWSWSISTSFAATAVNSNSGYDIMANHTITVTVTIPQEYLRAHNLRIKKLGNQYALQHEHDHHRLAPLELFTQWENTPHQVLDYKVHDARAAQAQSEHLQDRVREAEGSLEASAGGRDEHDTWFEEMIKPRPHLMALHQALMDRAAENMWKERKEAEEGLQRSQEEAARRRQRNRSEMDALMRRRGLW